ncbi:MAG TPA: hypothetical protein VNA17_08725 [Pyrinomonadaceae bacterium]|nr:hypothetical protein [Pyrinomonadaceae bacterium]
MNLIVRTLARLFLLLVFTLPSLAQHNGSIPYKSQEVSDLDGIPVLLKHLPEWERVKGTARFATSVADLKAALGDRPLLDLIDFSVGTEAVTATYDTGKLLIIEYTSPQGSAEADRAFTAALSQSGDATTVYRRIGNYNALVFDASDRAAAEALLDQVKYEKQIQWLGDNPFIISAERAFVLTTSDIFLSTLLVILIGIGVAIFGGVISGYIFFYMRDGRRAGMHAFSDAGGMTRLNLDGLSSDE